MSPIPPPPPPAADQPSADASADASAGRSARKRTPPKSARRLAREIAMQGLYRWLLAGGESQAAEADVRDMDGFARADRAHFDALLHGCVEQAAAIDAVLVRHIDRATRLLSPVEHAVLMIGVYELTHCLDVPYRVVINEGVELAKTFGGTDGHKYVNGVLDRCATDLRPNEARPAR